MPTKLTTTTENTEKKSKISYIYAVGRRKTSIARTRLIKKGEGQILINGKKYTEYFPSIELKKIVSDPLKASGAEKEIDISVKVEGGGSRGQAEAVRHGIARALIKFNEELRAPLKAAGYLTRDSRKKERKKPGLKKARRGPQWAKR